MKTRVFIEKDVAGYYVAEIPTMPGCLSQGRTMEEAIANIKEASAGWLEVMRERDGGTEGESVEVPV